MSNFHHVIVLSIGLYNLSVSCQDDKEFPVNVEGVTKFRFLYNDICFFQPYEDYAKVGMVSIAFLTFDFYTILFLFTEWNKLAK